MTEKVVVQNSIGEIFKKYKSQLMGFISKRVLSKEDSEDILQNVFLQLSKADLMENPIEQISAWLYSVARNQIIDKSRKQKEAEMPVIKGGEGDDDLLLSDFSDVLLNDNSPETEYLRAIVWEELDIALNELPLEQREVFEWTELQGLSFKEISETTGIGINTLISRKRYAVLYLREKLRNLYEELLSD